MIVLQIAKMTFAIKMEITKSDYSVELMLLMKNGMQDTTQAAHGLI
jgi:hypothetical protein